MPLDRAALVFYTIGMAKKKRTTKKQKYLRRRAAAFSLLAALLVLGGAVLVRQFVKGPPVAPIAGETKYVKLLDDYVPVQSGVAPSPYSERDFYVDEAGRLQYAGDAETWFGIDVSSHQGSIDWKRVAQSGVEFAFLRVGSRGYTEGQLYRDTHFERNYNEASAAGLPLGVYFFSQATSVEEAEDEARLLLEILDGRTLEYPVVFDWEYVSEEARTTPMQPQQVSECCRAFCKMVQRAGYTPMVYFNCYTAYLYYDLAAVSDIDFWAAEFTDSPSFYYDYTILQYSCTGSVDGIEGDVDLNLAFVNYADS